MQRLCHPSYFSAHFVCASLPFQVERLSGLVDKASEKLSLDSELRLGVINSSVNIHSRIIKFFELIENDLYGKLQTSSAQIAVYRG